MNERRHVAPVVEQGVKQVSMDQDPAARQLPISVIVPVRNAEAFLEDCLSSIVREVPRELIVVDGMSTDGSVAIAQRYGAKVMSDDGAGVAAARLMGAQSATERWIALIDADVVLASGALKQLFDEFREGGYTALQAGLRSVSGSGYWGRALVDHHRTGRSKDWFGLVATIFDRDAFLRFGLDPEFSSGEDIELRVRMTQAGARIGVSKRTTVTHRFGDTFEFARGQWLADGAGLARTVVKHGGRNVWLVGLPLAASARGVLLSLARRRPIWIPYYLCYLAFNYVGMVRGLLETNRRRTITGRSRG